MKVFLLLVGYYSNLWHPVRCIHSVVQLQSRTTLPLNNVSYLLLIYTT